MSSEKNYLNDKYKSFFEDSLSKTDPELYKAISDELKRQQQHIELIASENIVSQAVLEAQGSVLTNKYAEGYPGKRYYNGCEHVDVAENLAIERLKKIFDCKFANAQPHSGAQANGAVFLALLNPGDTFMGMNITANRHKNIRAAQCFNLKSTKLSRLHNDANIITLGSRLLTNKNAVSFVNVFLNTKFDGGRHIKRIRKI